MYTRVVIDSGPLYSALILNYLLDQGRGSSAGNYGIHDPLLDEVTQRSFLRLLSSIKEKLITSHVVGELQGLVNSGRSNLHGDYRARFWRAGTDLLTQWNVDEKLVRLLDLASHKDLGSCFPRIGPTDTGVIDLARRHGCLLITEDERTLAPEAWRVGVDCILLKQFILLSF
jgi:rRNA-processing protein FCF1